ncbi:MAG: DUF3306 domain-containing protein [Oxalobacteraceae bacterium]
MAADDFFARWSRRKSDATSTSTLTSATTAPAAAPDIEADADADAQQVAKPLPTLADVEGLTAESDYAAFLVKGVDESVKRSAMKKLFALPQFNIMDGLDIYIGDYSQPDPLPPGMLEALNHARSALNPAQFFTKPASQLLDKVTEQMPVAANPPEATELAPEIAQHAPDNPAPALPQNDLQVDPQPVPVQHPDALPPAVETLKNEAV